MKSKYKLTTFGKILRIIGVLNPKARKLIWYNPVTWLLLVAVGALKGIHLAIKEGIYEVKKTIRI